MAFGLPSLDPREWSKEDIARGFLGVGPGGHLDPLGAQWGKDAAGMGGEVPGLQGYGDISSDLGIDPRTDPRTGKTTPGAYDTSNARVDQLWGQAGDDRERILGWKGTEPIRDVDPIRPREQLYHDVAAPWDVTAHDAGTVERYDPARIAAPGAVVLPGIGPVQRVTGRGYDAADMGKAIEAAGVDVGRTVIGSEAGRALRRQDANLDELAAVASGKTPSAAKARLDVALAEVAQQQMGLANQARGSERAGARLEAIQAIGEGGFRAAREGAAAELDERNAARKAYTGAISDARGQDILLAAKQADLTQQANSLQAEIDRALSMGNADMANQMKARQAQLIQQAREYGAAAANRADEINAGTANDRAMGLLDRELAVRTGNRDADLDVAIKQAGMDTDAKRFGAESQNVRDERFADRATNVDVGNVDRKTGVAVGNAQRRVGVDEGNAQRDLQGQITTEELQLRRDVSEADRSRGDFQTREGAVAGAGGRQAGAAGMGTDIAGRKVGGRLTERQLEMQKRDAQNAQAIDAEGRRRNAQNAAFQTGLQIFGAAGGLPMGGGMPASPQATWNGPAPSGRNPYDPFRKPAPSGNAASYWG